MEQISILHKNGSFQNFHVIFVFAKYVSPHISSKQSSFEGRNVV